MNALRADFDQPRRGRAPGELARSGAEPVLGLQCAGRSGTGAGCTAARAEPVVPDVKTISAGLAGIEIGGPGRRRLRPLLVEDLVDLAEGHVGDAVGELARGSAPRRARSPDRRRRSGESGRRGAAACCTGARPRRSGSTRASPAPTPLGCRSASSRRRRGRRRAPPAPPPARRPRGDARRSPRPVLPPDSVDGDQRRLRRREGAEDVLGEVHRPAHASGGSDPDASDRYS